MTHLTPEKRAELRAAVEERHLFRFATERGSDGYPSSGLLEISREVLALLDAADERDRLAAAVEQLAEWHETKAYKARNFRIEINGENRVMDKAAEVHDDAARRIRRALDGADDE